MTLGKKDDEREKYLNYIKERDTLGKYLNTKERREKIYMYTVRVIYVRYSRKKERMKRKIPDITESHYNNHKKNNIHVHSSCKPAEQKIRKNVYTNGHITLRLCKTA
jgi:hypothetical protein